MAEKQYVFDNVDTLINFLFKEFGELTPLKLQKSLYFLYAYYGALYSKEEKDGEVEEDFNLPSELFPAKFEAWTYGPVMREVYVGYKNSTYKAEYLDVLNFEIIKERYDEAINFIRDLFAQMKDLSDFTLVDRSHDDKTWKEAYDKGKSTLMDNKEIIKEYKQRYV